MKAYATTSANVTGAFPVSAGKNASTGSSVDGTPYHQDYISDTWALLQALMDRVGMTPSGTVEAYTAVGSGSAAGLGQTMADGAQQHLASFARNFGAPGELVFDVITTSPTRRVVPLQGQVLDGYLDPDLVYATWVGSGANGSATGFYTTSDAGGTTRATTGLTINGVTSGRYLVLPDFRGLSPIGLGVNAKFGMGSLPTFATGGSTLAAYLADQLQYHKHWLPNGYSGGAPTNPGPHFAAQYTNGGTGVTGYDNNGDNSTTDMTMRTDNTNSGGTARGALYTRTPGFACNIGVRY